MVSRSSSRPTTRAWAVYPLLGWLHPLDQVRLAQCPAHHPLRFTPVSIGDAQAELREFYRFFRR